MDRQKHCAGRYGRHRGVQKRRGCLPFASSGRQCPCDHDEKRDGVCGAADVSDPERERGGYGHFFRAGILERGARGAGQTGGRVCNRAGDGEYPGQDGLRYRGRHAEHHRAGDEGAGAGRPGHEHRHVDRGGHAAERGNPAEAGRAVRRPGNGHPGLRRRGRRADERTGGDCGKDRGDPCGGKRSGGAEGARHRRSHPGAAGPRALSDQ